MCARLDAEAGQGVPGDTQRHVHGAAVRRVHGTPQHQVQACTPASHFVRPLILWQTVDPKAAWYPTTRDAAVRLPRVLVCTVTTAGAFAPERLGSRPAAAVPAECLLIL